MFGLQATPDSSGSNQHPLASIPLARLPHPSGSFVAEVPFWSYRFGAPFLGIFIRFPSRHSNLSVRYNDVSLATLLSITYADVARLAKLKSASYLCLRNETVSPGFPTRTRLLIWSQSTLVSAIVAAFSSECRRTFLGCVSRFLARRAFNLAVLRTNLGPGANLMLLRARGLRCSCLLPPPCLCGQTEPPGCLPSIPGSRRSPSISGSCDWLVYGQSLNWPLTALRPRGHPSCVEPCLSFSEL